MKRKKLPYVCSNKDCLIENAYSEKFCERCYQSDVMRSVRDKFNGRTMFESVIGVPRTYRKKPTPTNTNGFAEGVRDEWL